MAQNAHLLAWLEDYLLVLRLRAIIRSSQHLINVYNRLLLVSHMEIRVTTVLVKWRNIVWLGKRYGLPAAGETCLLTSRITPECAFEVVRHVSLVSPLLFFNMRRFCLVYTWLLDFMHVL